MDATMNLQILLNTAKTPFLNQATQKCSSQTLLPKRNPE